jgi:hypothetical protein
MPTATRDEASIEIAAEPAVVYGLVTDVTQMGTRSPECYRCEWVDGATGPTVGARFKGCNRLGPLKWSTICEVTTAIPCEEFAFTVVDGKGREQTRWRYRIEQRGSLTRLTESYEFVWCPVIARIAEVPIPRDQQLGRGIRQTVAAIKEVAEKQPQRRPVDGSSR